MNFLGALKPRRAIGGFSIAADHPMSTVAEMLSRVLRGKEQVITDFLTAILAGGSILLEDLPGVGKTTLAKSFAKLVELKFDRLQCTPDLLPADVFGFSIFNAKESTFAFRPGPVFCNVLLVDEINRASPRTQSALLEAMAERQVTIEGESRALAEPFIVIATQNPSGYQGTYPLPEAQLDRFLFHLKVDYPDHDSEVDLLYHQSSDPTLELKPQISASELMSLQQQVQAIDVHRDLADYIVRIVAKTRESEELLVGCSPRGTQMLFRASQALAFLQGRKHVLPDDIQHVAPLTLAHRIVKRRTASGGQYQLHAHKRALVSSFVEGVTVPA
jgi:MoxR-like ATPase